MTYAIIGTGAIGGYYGAMLQRSGKEVHFLLHSDYEEVRRDGLRVLSPKGDFTLPQVHAYRHATDMPKADVVIVALKTTRQPLLAELLPPLLKPTTTVVLIQNGIGVEEEVQRLVPQARLAAGVAFICVDKPSAGTIRHQQMGRLVVAPFSCEESDAAAIVDDLTNAGLVARTGTHAEERWNKAIWNMPFNGLCTVLHATTDQTVNEPHSRALVRELMLEVIGAARALGVTTLTERHADDSIAYTESMTPYSPSMKLDFEQFRPMEIEYLYHRPVAMGEAAGMPMPRLKMLAAQLELIEKHHQRP